MPSDLEDRTDDIIAKLRKSKDTNGLLEGEIKDEALYFSSLNELCNILEIADKSLINNILSIYFTSQERCYFQKPLLKALKTAAANSNGELVLLIIERLSHSAYFTDIKEELEQFIDKKGMCLNLKGFKEVCTNYENYYIEPFIFKVDKKYSPPLLPLLESLWDHGINKIYLDKVRDEIHLGYSEVEISKIVSFHLEKEVRLGLHKLIQNLTLGKEIYSTKKPLLERESALLLEEAKKHIDGTKEFKFDLSPFSRLSLRDLINKLFENFNVINVGENHGETGSKKAYIEYISKIFETSKSPTVLFMEHMHSKTEIDTLRDLEKTESSKLAHAFFENLSGHDYTTTEYTYLDIFKFAKDSGTKVKPIDSETTISMMKKGGDSRVYGMNYFADKVIKGELANNPNAKCVTFVGMRHVIDKDIKGLNDLLQSPGIIFFDTTSEGLNYNKIREEYKGCFLFSYDSKTDTFANFTETGQDQLLGSSTEIEGNLT